MASGSATLPSVAIVDKLRSQGQGAEAPGPPTQPLPPTFYDLGSPKSERQPSHSRPGPGPRPPPLPTPSYPALRHKPHAPSTKNKTSIPRSKRKRMGMGLKRKGLAPLSGRLRFALFLRRLPTERSSATCQRRSARHWGGTWMRWTHTQQSKVLRKGRPCACISVLLRTS